MLTLTQAQLDALYQVYLRWQNDTGHPIMPEEYEIVDEKDYNPGDYIGTWVGYEHNGTTINGGHIHHYGSMYIGIERDGHTHS